jgi:hypothetical protein
MGVSARRPEEMQCPSAPDAVGSMTRSTPVALLTQPWNNAVPGSGMEATAEVAMRLTTESRTAPAMNLDRPNLVRAWVAVIIGLVLLSVFGWNGRSTPRVT